MTKCFAHYKAIQCTWNYWMENVNQIKIQLPKSYAPCFILNYFVFTSNNYLSQYILCCHQINLRIIIRSGMQYDRESTFRNISCSMYRTKCMDFIQCYLILKRNKYKNNYKFIQLFKKTSALLRSFHLLLDLYRGDTR